MGMRGYIWNRLTACLAVAVVLCAPGLGQLADAQTTWSNTSSTPVNETAASCSAPVRRTFNVTESGTVGDVDIGLLITHTYRGDLVTYLESPLGTRVQLTTNNGSAGGNNLNVLFDDDAATPFSSASTSANHAATAPPYENTLSPLQALSAFNGEAMTGSWVVEMCDFYNADSGNYVRADLTLTPAIPGADLSLSAIASSTSLTTGDTSVITFSLDNAGPDATGGIAVSIPLPSGLAYVSDTSGGAYNPATGLWTLPTSLASGASTAFQLTVSANASGSGSIIAEVASAGLADADSTPGNVGSAPAEDDTAYVSILVNGPPPGTPPTLSCSAGLSSFDWDSETWTAGSLSQTYATGVGFGFTVTGDTAYFQNNGAFGGQNPALSTTLTGGLATAEQSLHMVVNYTSSNQQIAMSMDVGTTGVGVEALQFTLFDVDINPNTSANAHFIDRVQVVGYLGGSPRLPILTSRPANTVSGATATGTAGAASGSADGNVTITFDQAVDRVVFTYDNDPAVNPNPGQQGISMHDIAYCQQPTDFGDAPASYGTPSHLITSGIRLGSAGPDHDSTPYYSTDADGDDTSGSDDEDAITFPPLSQGQSTTINIPVTGAGGYLQAWIDWNGDNAFQAGEQVASDLQTASSLVSVPLSVPVSATTGQTVARLRWSTQAGLGFDGPASDGEVEDHALTITALTGATCPSGLVLDTRPGTADTVITAAENSTLALGQPETAGTTTNAANSARVTSSNPTLTLDMSDLVAVNATLNVVLARDSGSGNVTVSTSADNATYTALGTFNAGPNDTAQTVPFAGPTEGARYIRFQRTSGRVWIAGVSYSEVCVIPATLNGTKSTAIHDPLGQGLFAIPGNDMIYTITVSNSGEGAADTNSVVLIDAMPATLEFYNGATTAFGGEIVGWSETSSNLSFDPATDLAFSNAASKPADFASCTYSPAAGYDPAVTYICFNPKGAFAYGDPNPEFSISFRGRIK